MTGCAQLDCSEGSCFNAHVKVITWNRMDWTTHCIVHVPGLILPWKAEKQVWGHRTMAGETLLLGVVAVIALVAPDSCFFFFLKTTRAPGSFAACTAGLWVSTRHLRWPCQLRSLCAALARRTSFGGCQCLSRATLQSFTPKALRLYVSTVD